jgi:adenylate cyclase
MSLDALERDLTRWLVDRGLDADSQAMVLEGFCARLLAGGVPLWRAATGTDLLHPLLDARGCRWRRGEGATQEEYPRIEPGADSSEEWQRSPFQYLLTGHEGREMRRRLDDSYERGEFPLLDQFQDAGCTDYVAFMISYGAKARSVQVPGLLASFQVDRPGGFLDAELTLLRRLAPALGLAYKAMGGFETARTLVTTYLGADAGGRVLDGAILRGATETVRSVLWYSDLEGFTRIADTAPGDALIALLNDYAECVVEHVQAQGGQVLKFIGDGILAMFPLRDDASPCARALDATAATLAAVERLSLEREAAGSLATGLHVALHVGEVLYGNIGSRDRLDFTVVGPAVNEVARIEALCRSLEQQVIVSSAFAAEAGDARARLVSLGRYALKGVRRPEELFTLDPGP